MTQYGIAVDVTRCMGCHTCSLACKLENNLPEGVYWNRVLTEGGESMDSASGKYGSTHLDYYTMQCQHCENPACVKVCPVGATYKDSETGIVCQDPDKCIGCRMCMAACPYTGVRSFNWEEPRHLLEGGFGDSQAPKHLKHTVEKCVLCGHRVARGEEPACVAGCPAYARTFGDLDDPESAISKLVATRSFRQLLDEKGTKPSVYYLL